MKKAMKYDIRKLSPEELLEGFISEAALEALETQIGTVAAMNEHGARSRAYADEIVARGGQRSLLPLLDNVNKWIAYSAASALAALAEFEDPALATLDRIAEENGGSASSASDTARNMIRYGNPLGSPEEVEKGMAEIWARNGAK